MKYQVKITSRKHLVAWLRFIQESRPSRQIHRTDTCEFDFVNADFLKPEHLSSLACLIEEYKLGGAKIKFKLHRNTEAGKFLMYTKFANYWGTGFDRNYCFNLNTYNTIPIWKYDHEKIDAYANLIADFYSGHCIKDKDLTPLRITIVEALNNINDHSESKVGGFIFTQYYAKNSELEISICDFGTGIPKKVNTYMRKTERKPLSDIAALEEALILGFSTKSKPHNAGRGLDTILGNVRASQGEIQIISNKAFYSKRLGHSKTGTITDNMSLNFRGTYLMIRLNTSHFLEAQDEIGSEMNVM